MPLPTMPPGSIHPDILFARPRTLAAIAAGSFFYTPGVQPTVPTGALTAVQCPAVQGVPANLLSIATAMVTPGGNSPTGKPGAADTYFMANIIDPNLTMLALMGRYGGGAAYALPRGMEPILSNGGALILNVSAGHAIMDGVVEFAATSFAVPDNHSGPTDRVWIWGQQGALSIGTIVPIANSLVPPAGNCVLLGSVTTSGGTITAIDMSGVMYTNGALYRHTADLTAPTDLPPTNLRFVTKNPYTRQEWIWTGGSGGSHVVIPSPANPLPISAGGTGATSGGGGPMLTPVKSANYTLNNMDWEVLVDGTPPIPNFTITMPLAATMTHAVRITRTDDDTAFGAAVISLVFSGGQTYNNGTASISNLAQFVGVTFVPDPANNRYIFPA